MTIVWQRLQALRAITKAMEVDENPTITDEDYVIDAMARRLLSLPRRPEGNLPYSSWIVGDKEPKGFRGKTFAKFVEDEAKKELLWTPNSEATKYTKPFAEIGFRGRFAWCAAFVRWCLIEYGVSIPILCEEYPGYSYALCESFQKMGQDRGWYTDNSHGRVPRAGALILFDWNQRNINEPDNDWEDHIGVYLSSVDSNRFRCAEGNSKNQSGVFVRYFASVQGWVTIPEGTKTI